MAKVPTLAVLKQRIRERLNRWGIDVHRYSTTGWRWSYHVEDYYPVNPTPRWGYGKPPHHQIKKLLLDGRENVRTLLSEPSDWISICQSIPQDREDNSLLPKWRNGWFENFDAASLIAMLSLKRPTRYVEIGSGNSTKFARYCIEQAALRTLVISYDPEPRERIDDICDRVIRKRLEDCDLSEFEALQAGDILFFDGSHRVFTNSDVTALFLDIIPYITKGVILHVHDIFLPWDYPSHWQKRMYSEQYILAAMLLGRDPQLRVLLPNFFACHDPELAPMIRTAMKDIGIIAQGWSFWMEKT